ncbi:hypothetical protein KM043_003541 [Ampulex compressa]|nr:hypothetical protein KM043_003541 [Ampulex compressa]
MSHGPKGYTPSFSLLKVQEGSLDLELELVQLRTHSSAPRTFASKPHVTSTVPSKAEGGQGTTWRQPFGTKGVQVGGNPRREEEEEEEEGAQGAREAASGEPGISLEEGAPLFSILLLLNLNRPARVQRINPRILDKWGPGVAYVGNARDGRPFVRVRGSYFASGSRQERRCPGRGDAPGEESLPGDAPCRIKKERAERALHDALRCAASRKPSPRGGALMEFSFSSPRSREDPREDDRFEAAAAYAVQD